MFLLFTYQEAELYEAACDEDRQDGIVLVTTTSYNV